MKLTLRPANRVLARQLETQRFVLKPLGLLETLRVTNSWRHDTELLTGIYHSGQPMSLIRWLGHGPLPNNVDRFAFAIIPKGTAIPIGVHSIKLRHYRSAYNSVGLHDRTWWGKGVVAEARIKLMNHFFAHGIERFAGEVDGRNAASIFNYRKLGYDHVGTWHRQRRNPTTGDVLDILLFEMSRDKWNATPFAEQTDGR